MPEMTEDRLRDAEAMAGRLPKQAAHLVFALIAALRQAWQERDIEAKAALACNDALVRERAALATAQAERYALLRSVDMEVTARRNADAALTEARRVLRDVVAWVDKGCPDGCPVCPGQDVHAPDCAIAAVLAQERSDG